jgi:hypothetical protein
MRLLSDHRRPAAPARVLSARGVLAPHRAVRWAVAAGASGSLLRTSVVRDG